jgi:hypothetical protein
MGKRGPYKQYLSNSKIKVPRTTQYRLNKLSSEAYKQDYSLTLDTNKLQDEINESSDLRNNERDESQNIVEDTSPVNNNDINNENLYNDDDNDENNVENLVDSTESICDKSPQKFNIEYTDNVTREELAAAYLTAI